MSESAATSLAGRLRALQWPGFPSGTGWRGWLPAWSVPAMMRAVRATLVVPVLFVICLKVIGNPQMTLFAVFGGFASLLLASFGGSRRDKAVAHLGLAVVGSLALIIGTLVSGSTWLAAVVTIPVTFAIFFAGVAGPNTASGVTGALLLYVLPVATAAPASSIPWRLAGWWLASAAAAAAVLLLSPRSAGDKLRESAAASARALARHLSRSVDGTSGQADWDAALAAKRDLLNRFGSTPLRPTGLATTDQGLANVVELLEWCTSLIGDTVTSHQDLDQAAPVDLELLGEAALVLDGVADLLAGQNRIPDLERLEQVRAASATHQAELTGDPDQLRVLAAHAAHAQVIAVAARAAILDALIASGRASPELIAAERRRWLGRQGEAAGGGLPALTSVTGFFARHASIRSVWFRNALRGSVALAIAVAVADVSGVQHGFWVVLGTLSVLRTNAAATGATALRALAGTAIGFVVGAALLIGIGTGPAALWVALPCAVFVAGYAPGTTPFAVGQAAFTVTVVVVFNLLVPAGWRVGLLRIEDVAIGCGVSVVVGLLFWPRGASSLVGNDLADAFRRGSSYLAQAVDFALGLRTAVPDTAMAAVTAGIRLDEALRAYLTEQGTKRLDKHDLWGLVLSTTRLRLTAYSVASLHELTGPARPPGLTGRASNPVAEAGPAGDSTPGFPDQSGAGPAPGPGAVPADGTGRLDRDRSQFQHLTTELVVFYDRIADQVAGTSPDDVQPTQVPALTGPSLPVGVACAGNTPAEYQADMLWVGEYLFHLGEHAQDVTGPAAQIASLRQHPWWR
ncbi:MAG: FUSC family protein [Streptosporangiaceae bacterium]